MTLEDIKKLSKAIDNSISYEDFEAAAQIHRYHKDYIDTIWLRWCQSPLYFISSHEMGETIFEMIMNKINAEKIIQND
jgi:hypothetical protein